MSFISKLWKDRVSDYPNKRKLTKEDGTSETVTVERAEGDIVVAGDAFNAENMNDLETRIQNGFNAVEQAQAELNENLTEYVSMKYVSTGDSDVHIKFKIIDTSQLRAYITALITSQSGQPVMLTVSINIENNTIKSWNQITPINNSFGIQSVNIEEGGIQVKFNSVGVWGVCQYWGTGISI